ncbi:cell surface glycoprotein 1-like [Patiria miniata]|uniref:PH domain-containing protein n=1 Tax=Patiria miniata TaxID=46514 RepID=A0A914B016_PATMI|nr:cell surface glycoprotein 1-like [Patiria miniata]
MNSKRGRKKEGFLQVKLSSRSALGKAWKRKWVVVQQNTSSTGKSLLLELYMEKGAYHKTVTSLLLEGVVKVQRTTSKKQEHAIEISSASKVLLAVSADSEMETQDWLSMFRINLLPPVKELACPPGIPEDFMRVSVIPNKDSERLKLAGDYFAHISLANINLYDTETGDIAQEWDLRHLKKFMLISKCHQLDAEKIVHILPSNRSPHGEGEFIFFSAKGKQLVEGIYERLSIAMTVKSRRSRSTSMLFEITPQELEQMFKDGEQPPEEIIVEADEEEKEGEKGEVNGEAAENEVAPESKEIEANGVKEDFETKQIEPVSDEKEDAETKGDDAATKEEGPPQEEGKIDRPEETDAQVEDVEDAKHEVQIPNGDVEVSPPDATLEDVAQEMGNTGVASESQDAVVENSVDETDKVGSADIAEHEDDKANQTNPEEMDEGLGADSDLKGEEQTTTDVEVVESSQADNQVENAFETTRVEQVESQPVNSEPAQEDTSDVITAETSGAEENPPVTNDTGANAAPDETSTQKAIEEKDASDTKVEESPNSVLKTEQVASSPPQETPDSKEDAVEEMKNTELESGLQEKETSVDKPNPHKETVEADDANPTMQPTPDLQEQAEQSSDTKESPQAATGEDVPVEEGEAAEVVDAAEPVKDSDPSGLDQGATCELSETENVAQVQENISSKDPSETGMESTSSSPESASKVTTEPAEPIQHQAEEELSKESADAPNPNLNNSNANLPVRPNSKTTVPLPNTLTSRMAEAMRNAQKRKQSTEASPSHKTQTDFPPDQEIIV